MSSLRGEALDGAVAPPWWGIASGTLSVSTWRVRPLAVLHVAIALMLVAQLGRIPLISTGTREAPLLLNDLCLLAVVAAVALAAVTSRSFQIDRVGAVALAFATVGAGSAVAAVSRFGLTGLQLVISLAYLARWLLYFAVYLAIVNIVKARDVATVWSTLEATMLVFAGFGIIQAIFLPHFAQLIYPDSRLYIDWDEQRNRLVSTVLDPNIAGAMILLVLLVQLAQVSSGERVPLWKPMVMFSALMATLSRSSFVGLVVGGLFILCVRGISRRMLRLSGVVLMLGLAALPRLLEFARGYNKLGIDASAMSRVASWIRALEIWGDNPIFGVGFNTFGFVSERYGGVLLGASSYSSDGGLLFIGVMTGVVGLSLYSAMLFLVLRHCRRVWRDSEAPSSWRALAIGIAAATVAVCVNSLFVNSLLTPFVMEPLWILWGLAFVMRRASAGRVTRHEGVRLVACRVGS